jgi:hypothetical protein
VKWALVGLRSSFEHQALARKMVRPNGAASVHILMHSTVSMLPYLVACVASPGQLPRPESTLRPVDDLIDRPSPVLRLRRGQSGALAVVMACMCAVPCASECARHACRLGRTMAPHPSVMRATWEAEGGSRRVLCKGVQYVSRGRETCYCSLQRTSH